MRGSSDFSSLLGLGLATGFAVVLGGVLYTSKGEQIPINNSSISTSGTGMIADYEKYTCCDTGDGNNCTLVSGKTITYRDSEYGLLRSNMFVSEGNHVKPTDYKTPSGERIFHIESSGNPNSPGLEPRTNEDVLYGGESDDNPHLIPKETLIYVCRSGDEACDEQVGKAVFDGYWRADVPISDEIKFCVKRPTDKPDVPYQPRDSFPATTIDQIIVPPVSDSKNSLQIGTFNVKIEQSTIPFIADWLTPYCKPAIYLYPEQDTNVSVQVKPQGKMLLTIPEYPANGWEVLAKHNGDIYSGTTRFDYLYYEASIPDEKIIKPTEGFVVQKNNLKPFLTDLLPKLGLNEKEKAQFIEYWIKVLPSSPFYGVKIIPVSNLDAISPLTIYPTPENIIRVTLYFEPLATIPAWKTPSISTPSRDGFTVVEWGGLFKQDKDHPFTCFQ